MLGYLGLFYSPFEIKHKVTLSSMFDFPIFYIFTLIQKDIIPYTISDLLNNNLVANFFHLQEDKQMFFI